MAEKDVKLNLQESTEKLVEKWSDALEGKDKWEKVVGDAPKIGSDKKKAFVATMLEMTAQSIELSEKTISGDAAQYNSVLIPMIRRAAPALIGPEVFGTQPLTTPTGLIFALRSSYTGTTGAPYKRSESTILLLADAAAFSVGTAISSEGTGVGTVKAVQDDFVLVDITSGTFVAAENVDDAGTYASSVTTITSVYSNELMIPIVFPNYTGSYTTATAEGLSTDMQELGFDIESVSVTAKSRKLKAKWSLELEEDLNSVHGMSAEQLLSTVAAEEIAAEMNREFINKIDANAVANVTTPWNYSTADGRWEIEKYQNLLAAIERESYAVAQDTKRGSANFAIVNPGALTALKATGRLDVTNVDFNASSYVGMLNGSIKVYVDTYQQNDQILLGYKGSSEIDAGFYYAPYIPLKIAKGFGEEDNTPRLFFHTRYGLVDNPMGDKYYRKISLTNLP